MLTWIITTVASVVISLTISTIVLVKIVLRMCQNVLDEVEKTEKDYLKKLYEITDEAVKQASEQKERK